MSEQISSPSVPLGLIPASRSEKQDDERAPRIYKPIKHANFCSPEKERSRRMDEINRAVRSVSSMIVRMKATA